LDNAENNATAMEELEKLLRVKNIKFDRNDNRIGCFPHIINICVSHIVSSLTKVEDMGEEEFVEDSGEEDVDEDDEEDNDGYIGDLSNDIGDHIGKEKFDANEELFLWLENVKRNPVKRAHAVVSKVRSSGQRREQLSATIKTGNASGLFQDDGKNVKVKDLQLIKDVKHRWDSLYLMISRLRELRPVFSFLLFPY
jgi:hypothetical protein